MHQKQASPHTISSYRDTFRLLLAFLQKRLRKPPSALLLEDVEAPLVLEFLDELETERAISPRSRNLRLTAIRSFFRYVAFEAPANAEQIQRVLAIPGKRFPRALVDFLSRPEAEALLQAPGLGTWSGRRDHALMLLALQTGLRLSELTALKTEDLSLKSGAHARVMGKGRKERCTPLAKRTVAVLKEWLKEPSRGTDGLVFTNARGGRLSADGVQYVISKHVVNASCTCLTLSTTS
jgi:site-specific recombinase XerD